MSIKGTALFIKALKAEQVNLLFAYPGSAVIPLFDQLYQQKEIQMILPRHEQALVHEADGYARSTGKVGVCLVTSGPGATNIVTGIATANYDSVPLVCFCGQVRRDLIGNDAFQEVDIVGITRNISKYSIMVKERSELGRVIKEAFYIASTGKPGPVVVDLPVDMMNEIGSSEYPDDINIRSYHPNCEVHIGQIKKAVTLLETAKKPLFLAGGGIHIANASREFSRLAEHAQIPVISTIMGKGAIPTEHSLYIGILGMHGCYAANKAIMNCDVLCSFGCRFNDRITGDIKHFAPNAKIIHMDIDPASISRNIEVDIPIVADAKAGILKLLHYFKKNTATNWISEITNWKRTYPLNPPVSTGLSPAAIIETINTFYREAIVVTDVGQNQMWTAQYLTLSHKKKFLTSGGLGTMGYGLPAAIGAKLGNPSKDVICITGDGGIQMNIQELATAVLEELPLVILIMNNGYLGMVRQWQELMYEKRYAGTDLKSGNHGINRPEQYIPDFIRLAESYNAVGIRVFQLHELHFALMASKQETKCPVVIECMIDAGEMVYPMVKAGCSLDEMILGDDV